MSAWEWLEGHWVEQSSDEYYRILERQKDKHPQAWLKKYNHDLRFTVKVTTPELEHSKN